MIKIIAFEGTDGSGKSSIIREFNKKTNYKYMCIDRFLGSSFVYNRNLSSDILEAEDELNNKLESVKIILVYTYCNDDKKLIERLKAKGDEDKIKNIEVDRLRFSKYLEYTKFNKIEIDTGKDTIEESIDKIIKFVEGVEDD